MHSFRRRPVSAYWSDHLSPRMTPCLPGISSSLEHSSMIMARGEWRSNPYEFHSDRGTMPKPSQMISDRTEAQELFHRELLGARRNQSARKFNSSTRIVHTNIELRSFRNRRIIDREYIWKFVIRFYYYRHLIRSRNNPQLNLLNYEWNLGYARRGCKFLNLGDDRERTMRSRAFDHPTCSRCYIPTENSVKFTSDKGIRNSLGTNNKHLG